MKQDLYKSYKRKIKKKFRQKFIEKILECFQSYFLEMYHSKFRLNVCKIQRNIAF